MLKSIAIAAGLMAVTTVIHLLFMMLALKAVRARESHTGRQAWFSRLYTTAGTIVLLFVASLMEAAVWAFAYVKLGAISGAEKALYFSTVTFTTLGYGEIVLDPKWRLLASFEAANGIIMFGWTTAIVVGVVQRVYFKTTGEHEDGSS